VRKAAKARPAHPDQVLLDLCARAAELERQIALAHSQIMAKDEEQKLDIEKEEELEQELGIPDIEEKLGNLNQAIVRLRPITLGGFVAKAERAPQARAGDEQPADECIDEMLVTVLITDLVATEA
jgi:hypothetical protein